jgi:hypothetical protein
VNPQNREAGYDQCLISDPTLCLLTWRPVISQAVRLDNEPEIGPQEIHPESTHMLLGLRSGQPRNANDPQKPRLKIRVGDGECPTIKHALERGNPFHAAVIVELLSKRARIDQLELVCLVHGRFQMTFGKTGREIQKRPGGRRDGNLVTARPI